MSKIPYNLNKIKGVVFDIDGVLSPTVVPLGKDGVPCRMANLRDGYALKLASQQRLKIALISGADDEAVRRRFSNLGISDIFLKAGQKLDILKQWMAQNNLSPEEVAFVGDDIPDRDALLYVGLPIVPADAAEDVKEIASYITVAPGGYGVARELLEEILRARSLWPLSAPAYG